MIALALFTDKSRLRTPSCSLEGRPLIADDVCPSPTCEDPPGTNGYPSLTCEYPMVVVRVMIRIWIVIENNSFRWSCHSSMRSSVIVCHRPGLDQYIETLGDATGQKVNRKRRTAHPDHVGRRQ